MKKYSTRLIMSIIIAIASLATAYHNFTTMNGHIAYIFAGLSIYIGILFIIVTVKCLDD
jgi:hypothetical protein